MLQFRAMPSESCDAMRIFTKLLKPNHSSLSERMGYDEFVVCVVDSLLQRYPARVHTKCESNLGLRVWPYYTPTKIHFTAYPNNITGNVLQIKCS